MLFFEDITSFTAAFSYDVMMILERTVMILVQINNMFLLQNYQYTELTRTTMNSNQYSLVPEVSG